MSEGGRNERIRVLSAGGMTLRLMYSQNESDHARMYGCTDARMHGGSLKVSGSF